MTKRSVILALREESEFSRELREQGFEVFNLPMIETRRLSDLSQLRKNLAVIERFDHIFLTSRASASVLADELTPELLAKLPPVHVLGDKAREVLEKHGVTVKYKESANTANELLDMIGESTFAGTSILFIRGEMSMRTIPERLGSVAEVVEATVYETVDASIENKAAVERLAAGEVDWLCFFSPSAVESFKRRNFADGRNRPKAAVIGATTEQSARSLGYDVDFISERASSIDFARGLARHIKGFE